VAVTWSTSNKSGGATLSNGNLTATSTTVVNTAMGRSDTSFSSGSFYWEMSCDLDSASSIAGGIANSTETYATGADLAGTVNSVGSYTDGNTYNNSTIVTGGGGINNYTTGNRIGFAVIAGASSKLWNRIIVGGVPGNWNNAAIGSQNPATNTGGINLATLGFTGALFPAYNVNYNGTAQGKITGFFLASSWQGSAPSGFSSLDPVDVLMSQIVMRPRGPTSSLLMRL